MDKRERMKKSYDRKHELIAWLNGEGERSPTEVTLVAQFGGKNAELYATQAIIQHRKMLLSRLLSGEGVITLEEEEIKKKFGGIKAEEYAQIAIGLDRKRKMLNFLEGND